MKESENIKRIDKLLQPEVDKQISAMDKSFAKYGNIFKADEFLTTDNGTQLKKGKY